MTNPSPLPIFYINLRSRPDRREFMEAQFSRLGLVAERFDAVTIADVPPELIAQHTDRRIMWPIGTGDIACGLSHQAIWQLMHDRGLPAALILEDDAILTEALLPLLDGNLFVQHRADILKLETRRNRVLLGAPETTIAGTELRELQSSHMGTAAYIVSGELAHRSIDHPLLGMMAVDRFLFGKGGAHLLRSRILQATPSPVVQLDRLGAQSALSQTEMAKSDLVAPRKRRESQRQRAAIGDVISVNADHTARLLRLIARDPAIMTRKRGRVRFAGDSRPTGPAS